jgi:hypothetical protein
MIEPNTMVRITDANGDTHDVEALSGVTRGHKMAVVWVNVPRKTGASYEPMPWPAEYVAEIA